MVLEASLIMPEDGLNQFLLAEIAGQRGRVQLAARSMIDLAEKSQDARIARRAAEIAFQSRLTAEAHEALILWLRLEPDSAVARQAFAALLGTQGPLEKVAETANQWLAEKNSAGKADNHIAPILFLQLPALLARYPDAKSVAATVAELAKPYPALAEAHYAVAMTAYVAGQRDVAATEIDVALKLKPALARAAIAKAQLIRIGDTGNGEFDEHAASYLETYLKAQPGETVARVAYARLLVAMKSLLSAREQFLIAAKEQPREPEMAYAIGLISLQMEDWAEADKQFNRTIELMPRDVNPVYFNLGLSAEGRKDIDGALSWYRKIGEGEYFVNAQLKIAGHLTKRDGIERGRKFLQDAQEIESDSPEIQNQLVLAEVQLLREAKAFGDAYVVLTEALKKQPQAADLRYDRAMIAEKLNRIDDMEADLRALIAIKPDFAQAYNALGYTFAERGIRLAEADKLIRQALELTPNDAFIKDSLGWVQFKMGRADEAAKTLRDAYTQRPDPEIAAHLAEVLWHQGKKDEARQLWQRALNDNPGNDALMALMARFKN